ncbi:hypothetical protein CNMCM5793_006413 [Aspergillus hiratsukae]|uniref:Nucleoside phosphorylase domain-containing protein n=1 Tax=Aspergillus hiratsukae TaxID=1194566 RepID=A0A8H6UGX9_9EURO|nr:hypothetical protein CNMCM5793_006413 [Aspergillus hiratsukae]KAF7173807.1 hypothetical protein CNMCM6106_007897 [Aspergillus hiratsukae]
MIYSVMETNELPSSDLHVLTGQPVLVSAQETSNISNSLGHTSVQSPQIENGLDPQSSAALTVLHSNPDDHHDQSTEDEIQLLEEQIDQVLDPDVGTTAAEVWEDTRSISRKAKRLALEALCSPQASVSTTLETPPTFTHKDYTVGWICTRPVEFAVAEAMLDEQHPALPQIGNDSNAYTLGSIARHNVVLVCIPAGAMDTGAASTAVSGMLHSFPNIRIRLLVGIAGGVPNSHSDMRLGDVVVGSPIFGSGGIILLDSNNDEVDEMGTLETPPRELGNALLTLQARHMRRKTEIPQYVQDMIEANPAMRLSFSAPDPEGDLLFSAGYTHTHSDLQLPGCLSCDPSHVIARPPHRGNPAIHYGLIGWTKSVINNGLTRDAIASQRYMPSIELGTMGLINFFPCLVIRGIWNYLDSHKNRIWQRYAAATAAAYAKELLDTLPTTHVQ